MSKKKKPHETQIETAEEDSLKNYLDYYKNLKSPGYAVLVTGPWGSGKTFQVKAALEQDDICYVSLFGLSSETDVYGAVLAKMLPELANRKKAADFLKDKNISAFGFGAPLGSVLAAAIDVEAKERADKSKLIVFDDLERCPIDLKMLLGLFNYYVEHHGCRLIVIAHDDKIISGFIEVKEKVFGQTIKIVLRTSQAFDHFMSELELPARQFVTTHRALVESILHQSKCSSLRILRHVLADLGRLRGLLTDEQIADVASIKELLGTFIALDVELRNGSITRGDIEAGKEQVIAAQLAGSRLVKNIGKEPDAEQVTYPFFDAYQKYEGLVDISGGLNKSLLAKMLVDGQYIGSEFQEGIKESTLFRKQAEVPSWLTYLRFDQNESDVVEAARSKMDEQFQKREIVNLGELLHVIALRFMRVEKGLTKGKYEGVVKESKAYLDDLVAMNKFPLEIEGELLGPYPSYWGHVFWMSEHYSKHFDEIRAYVNDCLKRTWLSKHSEFKIELLDLLTNDVEYFYEVLNHSEFTIGKYYRIPVMLSIKPSEFVSRFLSAPKKNWRAIERALRERITRIHGDNSLSVEKQWFDDLKREMEKAAIKAKGTIDELRILRRIP